MIESLFHHYKMQNLRLLAKNRKLTGREQMVKVNGELSSFKLVLSGILQGSVLGPLLFLLYINDFLDTFQSNVLIIADDTMIKEVLSSGDAVALQNDIDELNLWSEKWLLKFNTV